MGPALPHRGCAADLGAAEAPANPALPRDQRELCLATAWRLVEDGQTVLIYLPGAAKRRTVRRRDRRPSRARRAALAARSRSRRTQHRDRARRGMAGADSAILRCLRLGVALHHGALPTAYRKEVERLLRESVLKVTISSPTLAQGLNLSATAVDHAFPPPHRREDRDLRVQERHRPRRTRLCRRRRHRAFSHVRRIAKKRRELGSADQRSRRARNGKRAGAAGRRCCRGCTRASAAISISSSTMSSTTPRPGHFPRSRTRSPRTASAPGDWERHRRDARHGDPQPDRRRMIFRTTAIEAALDDILQSSLWHRRLQRSDEQVAAAS